MRENPYKWPLLSHPKSVRPDSPTAWFRIALSSGLVIFFKIQEVVQKFAGKRLNWHLQKAWDMAQATTKPSLSLSIFLSCQRPAEFQLRDFSELTSIVSFFLFLCNRASFLILIFKIENIAYTIKIWSKKMQQTLNDFFILFNNAPDFFCTLI